MTLSKKPERDCDSMEVRLWNRGWNEAIDAITSPPAQRTWVEVEQVKWEGERLIAKLKENT